MLNIPTGNLTAFNNDIVHGWISSSGNRGTTDVLYSCLVTITLCIYTAIHLNIPEPDESGRHRYLRLAKWITVGIFTPEWVIYAAWSQWRDARELLECIKDNTGKDEGDAKNSLEESDSTEMVGVRHDEEAQLPLVSNAADPDGYTQKLGGLAHTTTKQVRNRPIKNRQRADLSYAFFVTMGGLRVDVSDITDRTDSVVLSNVAFLELIRSGGYQHVQIDHKLIEDRSKANNLAKLLVCSQVIWMATQCISRKAFGMPLTLLELHTFSHVVCALCIYGFWFKKPLNVNEAITISLPDEHRTKIAYALGVKHKEYLEVNLNGWCDCWEELHILKQEVWNASPSYDFQLPPVAHSMSVEAMTGTSYKSERRLPTRFDMLHDHAKNPNEFHVHDVSGGSSMVRVSIPPGDRDWLRWHVAKSCSISASENNDHLLTHYTGDRQTTYPVSAEDREFLKKFNFDFVLAITSIVLGDMTGRSRDVTMLLPAAVCITSAYGGIHAIAWQWAFPSRIETWLWRGACLDLIATIPIIYLSIPVMDFVEVLRPRIGSSKLWISVVDTMINCFCFGLPLSLALAYVTSRVFLVVEIFVSLRAVPVGVYASIPWTHYIPHV